MPKVSDIGTIEITRYQLNKEGRIEITHVKALDKDGKYIKFMPHDVALKVLYKFPVTFKKLNDE